MAHVGGNQITQFGEAGEIVVVIVKLFNSVWRWSAPSKAPTSFAESLASSSLFIIMTVTTTFIALLPILWATGTGADVKHPARTVRERRVLDR